MSTPLLILRPEPGASATATKARALGFYPVVAPLFEICTTDWDAPDPAGYDAVMLTSANAARHGGAHIARFTHLPLYAVGAATADAARALGFERIKMGNKDATALLAQIAADGHQHVLHLAGKHHRAAAHHDLQIERHIAYESALITPAPALPDTAYILLHSPRAAERLAEIIAPATRSSRTLIAISDATAQAAGTGWAAIHTASAPNDDALLACAAQLCKLS